MRIIGLSKTVTGCAKKGKTKSGKASPNKLDRVRKIVWPDLVFAPVNLWSLPSASFFYRNQGSGQ
jgi:hypothetical protein